MEPLIRGLKVFVVLSGIILVAGTVTLVWLLARSPGTAPYVTPAHDIAIPQDARLRQIEAVRGGALLHLQSEREDRLLLIDPRSGEVRREIRLVPSP